MPLRFTLRQLEYFIAVGESGSIALAAEKVNVTAPSMSSAIAQLEGAFGVQLLVRRHAQGCALTPAGERFIEQARVVLEDAEKLNDMANIYTGSVRGSLRVGCLRTFVQFIVPQLRRSFENKYDQIEFFQIVLDQGQIFDALSSARIDLALTYDMALPSDIRFQPLCTLPTYVMLAADHPLAGHKHLSAEDLVDQDMVLLDMPHSAEYFLSMFRAVGRRPRISERTPEIALQRSLVANGFGFGISNMRTVSEFSMDGKGLKFVPLETTVPPLHLGLATSKATYVSRKIQAFIDHCREAAAANQLPGLVT
ncbi:LysR family transcriptional regulator [Roseinatronobacter sp. S2]|uniref:LysR family transcriptional regulator n=1 Tax=Roseinatronobacter sp. S2 TaxID=3035471 RepID=UPI0024100D91|nr:LysR family transcriptional regulator [Roseinatronobacter sp. S2]MCC5958340.1 LysR family transcriptional regulator [Paracoccaceae bacterium]WFE76646.1 LysR family transcriptional regulator [Roseinatronobacter sp. S2]